jgi:hypothetical protein
LSFFGGVFRTFFFLLGVKVGSREGFSSVEVVSYIQAGGGLFCSNVEEQRLNTLFCQFWKQICMIMEKRD